MNVVRRVARRPQWQHRCTRAIDLLRAAAAAAAALRYALGHWHTYHWRVEQVTGDRPAGHENQQCNLINPCVKRRTHFACVRGIETSLDLEGVQRSVANREGEYEFVPERMMRVK